MLNLFGCTPSSDALFQTSPLYKCVEDGDLELLKVYLNKTQFKEKLVQNADLLLSVANEKGHQHMLRYLNAHPEVIAAREHQQMQQRKLDQMLRNKKPSQ